MTIVQKPYCIKPNKCNCIKYLSLNMDALMYLQKIKIVQNNGHPKKKKKKRQGKQQTRK